MILLAVDTSSGDGSLALAREDGWREVAALPAAWKSATLHGELDRLLNRHGLKSRDLDAYAVASGPGAFTGLRIGLTAVKALAEVHGKPVVPVSTLEVVAAAARDSLPQTFSGELAPLLDARRGQVFAALYGAEPDAVRAIAGESVGSLQSFLDRVRANSRGDLRFCGPEPALFSREIMAAGWNESFLISTPAALAGTLARIAFRRLKRGEGVPAAAAEANYVRRSDAEMFWKG
jgi:tRNA threonylcarbamoyladenosine biosynthesis protein TsaB